MGKKKEPLSFAEKLQKTIEKQQRRQNESFAIYAKACKEQGVKLGEPINVMALLGKKRSK